MGTKYAIYASKYPYDGKVKVSYRTDSFISFIWHLLKFQRKGYDIIDVAYRNIKINTSNWNSITMSWSE